MKTKLFSLLFVLGAFTTSYAQDQTPVPAPAPVNPKAPIMKFAQLEYDFVKVEQGQSVTHEFKFKNTGKEPLLISNAQGSCGCTVPDYPKTPIKPGASGIIKVTFNSTGKMGQQDKTVTITSNNKDGQVVLHVKGEVVTPVVKEEIKKEEVKKEEIKN